MNANLSLMMILAAACLTGCASTESQPPSLKSLFAGSQSTDDPLVSSGRISDSYKAAKRELKNPEHTQIQFAKWCEDRGDHLEARQRYLDVLGDNPENVEARVGVARVEFATGRKAEAETILRQAAQKYPDNLEIWMEMGRIQSKTEQWAAAAESFSTAAKLRPADQNVHYELGLALARGGKHERALEELKVAVGESAAMYNIGFLLQEDGHEQEAAQWYTRVLRSHPDQRTRKLASQMLAKLSEPESMRAPMIASRRAPSRVIPEETSYQVYQETPQWQQRPAHAAGDSPASVPQPSVQTASATTASARATTERTQQAQSPRVSPASYSGQWRRPQSGPQPQVNAQKSTQASRTPANNAQTDQVPLWPGRAATAAPATPQRSVPQRAASGQPVEPPMWTN